MSAKRIAALVVVALLTSLLVSGCEQPTPQSSSSKKAKTAATSKSKTSRTLASSESSTAKRVASDTTTPTVATATGAITKPSSTSALRKALLDAARKKLGTSSGFYINQLYAQGDTALGDLSALNDTKVGRVFIAWEKSGSTWSAVSVKKTGTEAASAVRAMPAFSSALVSKVNWKLVKAAPSSASASTVKASLSSAATSWAKSNMSGAGTPYKITVLKVAKDSSGVWWGRAVVQPTGDATNSYDPLNIWAKYSGTKWTGRVQDPEPPAPKSYFPSSVVSALGL
jgi:hypothetical protein